MPLSEKPILFSGAMVRAILAGQKTVTRRVMNPAPLWDAKWGGGGAWVYGNGPKTKDRWHVEFDEEHRRLACLPEARGWGVGAGCPYGSVGDRLWVRETWYCDHCFERDYELTTNSGRSGYPRLEPDKAACEAEWREQMYYRADGEASQQFEQLDHGTGRIWHPSIHMPRWASRITLEVTGVRCERLQDITEEQAWAEGIEQLDGSLDDAALCGRAKLMGLPPTEARVTFAELWDSINGKRKGCAWVDNPWAWAVSFRRVTA